jgi:hypothetical protein
MQVANVHQEDLTFRSFPHRMNPDGTFDSICAKCFVTVANAIHETDLAHFERCHVCDSSAITLLQGDDIKDRFGNARRHRE